MKTALITGASAGIGQSTAMELARMGFHIVAMGRSESRTEEVVSRIMQTGGSAEPALIDLASLPDVRRAAGALRDRGLEIDILINNAGVAMARGTTSDGFEINFGVNHLGHFLLTHCLQDLLGSGSRIVNVTSSMHHRVDGIDFDRLEEPTRSLLGLDEYAVSKLANILFSRDMAERHPEWRTYAVHPGFTNTGIIKWWAKPFVAHRLIKPQEAMRRIVQCAADPALGNETGGYYSRSGRTEPSLAAQDDDLARELWTHSQTWCGVESVN